VDVDPNGGFDVPPKRGFPVLEEGADVAAVVPPPPKPVAVALCEFNGSWPPKMLVGVVVD
jgi:hypothetical protein